METKNTFYSQKSKLSMKKIFWFAACCLLATGFTACGDDDDENNGGPGGTGNTLPDVTTDLGIQYPVTSINGDEDAYFQYSNGKLTSGHTDTDINFNISQNPLAINCSYQEAYGSYAMTVNNIRVNNSGFITSANINATEDDNGEIYRVTGTANIQYDGEGHITEKKVEIKDVESTDKYTITYSWNNGNLMRIRIDEQYTEPGYGTENYTEIYEYTYDEDWTKNLNTGIYLYEMWYSTFDFMWYAGLLGKTTRNMPTGMTNIYMEDGVENYRTTYDFTTSYNSDGSVASLTYRSPGSSYYSRRYIYGYGNEYENRTSTMASIKQKNIDKRSPLARMKARMRK